MRTNCIVLNLISWLATSVVMWIGLMIYHVNTYRVTDCVFTLATSGKR